MVSLLLFILNGSFPYLYIKKLGLGFGNNTDWTSLDPAIVSYRQFPTYNNYGSGFDQNEFHPNLPGIGVNSHMNDFHYNPQPQNMGLGKIYDTKQISKQFR